MANSIKAKILRFFDEQAADYSGKYGVVSDLRSFIFAERKRIVLELLGGPFKRILDIGCGPGVYADELATRCGELCGVDISPEMIKLAEDKRYKNANFTVGAIEDLKFADSFFDGVVCVGVLEYLDDIEKGIEEVSRITADGGVAIFTAPNASSILNRLDYLMRKTLKSCHRHLKIDVSKSFINYDFEPRALRAKTIKKILRKHGFAAETVRFHIFRLSFLTRLSPALSLAVARAMNFISGEWLAINCIIKARKVRGDH